MNQQPEAVAVLEAAIQQVQARARAQQQQQSIVAAGAAAFLPASRFEGRKPGYFFSKGVRGVG